MIFDFTKSLCFLMLLLLFPRPGAFVPGGGFRSAGSHFRYYRTARLKPSPPLSTLCSPQRRGTDKMDRGGYDSKRHENNMHGISANNDCNSELASSDPTLAPKIPFIQPPTAARFRFVRGGTPGDSATVPMTRDAVHESMMDIYLDRREELGGGGSGDLGSPKDIGDLLFLARSSQPGSIGHELQRRGLRFFPKEAFVDAGWGEDLSPSAAAEEARYSWGAGTPLPREIPMSDLELLRDEEGRVRLVLWDPCGPDHPLIRAVEGEPRDGATVEVLNFPPRGKKRGEEGGSIADGHEFDELRSAVVFKRWFNVEQQESIADALGNQIIDDEELGLASDRTHVPLIEERAALASIGDGMLAALSMERFSGTVEWRSPPVPAGENRDFTAVCYGHRAKMDKHRDTWKEWTLIVSIGHTIAFELGSNSEGSTDVTLELASGEGLLFNGHELYHAVRGVEQGTAPEFWKRHPLSSKAAFARVGLLSLKGFSTKGASPRWGKKGSGSGSKSVT